MAWTTKNILEATGGMLLCGDMDHVFERISIDSRQMAPEALFIAIKGEVHDAHRYIEDVINSGGRGVMIESEKRTQLPISDWQKKGITCVAVDNTIHAMGKMASFNRKRFPSSVVAITGSTGKTTAREMTASVVSQKYNTLSSKKNYNNEIGLPLTLFELNPNHHWAVVELGMNRLGEIARLTKICRPDIGVITNVSPVHLEGVGSIEGVMQAKGELLEEMGSEGRAVLNADDDRVLQLAQDTPLKVTLFGRSKKASIRADEIAEEKLGISFRLILPKEAIPIHMAVPGKFMVSNALAASTIGYLLGLSAAEIKAGLESFKTVTGRMYHLKTANGIHVINDAYNANPASMAAAIESFCTLKGNQRGVLVLGDMLELGNQADSLHKNLGNLIAHTTIERLYITGAFASTIQSGAIDYGLNTKQIFIGTKDEICENLTRYLDKGDWVLVKGSRGMRMEIVVDRLVAWGEN